MYVSACVSVHCLCICVLVSCMSYGDHDLCVCVCVCVCEREIGFGDLFCLFPVSVPACISVCPFSCVYVLHMRLCVFALNVCVGVCVCVLLAFSVLSGLKKNSFSKINCFFLSFWKRDKKEKRNRLV